MNQDQVMSIVRSVLQILGTGLVSKGVIGDADWTTIAGAILMVVPVGWGIYAHTQQQKIASVAAMPEVKTIVATPAVAAAADSSKVTTKVS
jgi:hypothetical protein